MRSYTKPEAVALKLGLARTDMERVAANLARPGNTKAYRRELLRQAAKIRTRIRVWEQRTKETAQ